MSFSQLGVRNSFVMLLSGPRQWYANQIGVCSQVKQIRGSLNLLEISIVLAAYNSGRRE